MWLVGVVSALGLKFSSSIDDVVWLAPFLTSNSSWDVRMQNSLIYTIVCMIQTCVAMVIACSGDAAVSYLTDGAKGCWTTEKILTVAAGSMLAVYAIKLTYEYIQELNEEGEEDGEADENGGEYAPVSKDEKEEGEAEDAMESGRACNPFCCRPVCVAPKGKKGPARGRVVAVGDGEDEEKQEGEAEEGGEGDGDGDGGADKGDANEGGRQQALFVMAFIGSIDDLTLFVPMLVGKGFDMVQLIVGAFIATVIIVSITICIGLCKPIADILAKIPLALIVSVFATILLVKGLVLTDK